MGRRVARARRRHATSRLPTPWRARSSLRAWRIASSSRTRRAALTSIARACDAYTLETREKIDRRACRRRSARVAHEYATRRAREICWTLGITEHHNAVDNVLALINLALLTGHVGRYGSGLSPLRGQNNVQGGGDMGAIPDRSARRPRRRATMRLRAKFERAWDVTMPRGARLASQRDVRRDRARRARTLYVIGENPRARKPIATAPNASCRSARTPHRAGHLPDEDRRARRRRLSGIGELVRDRKAPSRTASAACSACARALDPPGEARDDIDIVCDLARRLGHDWADPTAEAAVGRSALA